MQGAGIAAAARALRERHALVTLGAAISSEAALELSDLFRTTPATTSGPPYTVTDALLVAHVAGCGRCFGPAVAAAVDTAVAQYRPPPRDILASLPAGATGPAAAGNGKTAPWRPVEVVTTMIPLLGPLEAAARDGAPAAKRRYDRALSFVGGCLRSTPAPDLYRVLTEAAPLMGPLTDAAAAAVVNATGVTHIDLLRLALVGIDRPGAAPWLCGRLLPAVAEKWAPAPATRKDLLSIAELLVRHRPALQAGEAVTPGVAAVCAKVLDACNGYDAAALAHPATATAMATIAAHCAAPPTPPLLLRCADLALGPGTPPTAAAAVCALRGIAPDAASAALGAVVQGGHAALHDIALGMRAVPAVAGAGHPTSSSDAQAAFLEAADALDTDLLEGGRAREAAACLQAIAVTALDTRPALEWLLLPAGTALALSPPLAAALRATARVARVTERVSLAKAWAAVAGAALAPPEADGAALLLHDEAVLDAGSRTAVAYTGARPPLPGADADAIRGLTAAVVELTAAAPVAQRVGPLLTAWAALGNAELGADAEAVLSELMAGPLAALCSTAASPDAAAVFTAAGAELAGLPLTPPQQLRLARALFGPSDAGPPRCAVAASQSRCVEAMCRFTKQWAAAYPTTAGIVVPAVVRCCIDGGDTALFAQLSGPALLGACGQLFTALTCNGEWPARRVSPLLAFIVAHCPVVQSAAVYTEILTAAGAHGHEDRKRAAGGVVAHVLRALAVPDAARHCTEPAFEQLVVRSLAVAGVAHRPLVRQLVAHLSRADLAVAERFLSDIRAEAHLEPLTRALFVHYADRVLSGRADIHELLGFAQRLLVPSGFEWPPLPAELDRRLALLRYDVQAVNASRVDVALLASAVRRCTVVPATGPEPGAEADGVAGTPALSKEAVALTVEYAALRAPLIPPRKALVVAGHLAHAVPVVPPAACVTVLRPLFAPTKGTRPGILTAALHTLCLLVRRHSIAEAKAGAKPVEDDAGEVKEEAVVTAPLTVPPCVDAKLVAHAINATAAELLTLRTKETTETIAKAVALACDAGAAGSVPLLARLLVHLRSLLVADAPPSDGRRRRRIPAFVWQQLEVSAEHAGLAAHADLAAPLASLLEALPDRAAPGAPTAVSDETPAPV